MPVRLENRQYRTLYIDASNMAHRMFWGEPNRTRAISVMLSGFFNNLIRLREQHPGALLVVVLDSRSKRRSEESRLAVEAGLVPLAYKAKRHDRAVLNADELRGFHEQLDNIREILNFTNIPQILCQDYEADDIINTMVTQRLDRNPALIVSSDQDFMQLLARDVAVYDQMKNERWTEDRFRRTYGFDPARWLDVGALMGDVEGDGIYGVPGWGIKTATKYVVRYGGVDQIVEAVRKIAKPSVREAKLLQNLKVMELARSLTRFDVVPGITTMKFAMNADQASLDKILDEYGLEAVKEKSWLLI